MKKYKIMTAKKAVEKGLVKVGDEIQCITKIVEINGSYLKILSGRFYLHLSPNSTIRIPIPEQKTIDFGEAGRVLKYDYQGEDFFIVQTTGFTSGKTFAAFVLDPLKSSWKKGEVNMFTCALPSHWTDITDTYKP